MGVNHDLGIDNIYIVHGIKGYEQREKILNEVLGDKLNLDFEFFTESEDEQQNEAWINKYFIPDIKKKLPRGAVYCTLVHFLCYEQILKKRYKYSIIFENDVCFLGDFHSKIKRVIKEAEKLDKGFIISLENSTLKFPSLWETKKGKLLYPAKRGRCAGAYLIDQDGVKKMLESLKHKKCKQEIDWWHNDLIEENIVKMYWAHPALIEQGSFNGKFNSSIASRADGVIRGLKWQMQKMYKLSIRRLFKSQLQ